MVPQSLGLFLSPLPLLLSAPAFCFCLSAFLSLPFCLPVPPAPQHSVPTATLTYALLPGLPQGPEMAPRHLLGARLLLMLPLLCLPPTPTGAHHFSAPNTTLHHLALAPGQGALYVGAVNRLFQLSPELQLESVAITGPVLDSPDCVPFRDPAECPQAQLTDNTNQLLLVSGRARELVACGQVRQGVCEKRRLEDVAELLYRAEDPGDGQFVAANTLGVPTVGLVVSGPDRDLLLVARGLAGKLSAGVPPLTVRQLAGPQPFSSEGLGRLVVGDLSDYNNSYVAALADAQSAYFVFRRRGDRAQAEYRSYVARVCLRDANLYSYVEVPLSCRGHGLVQAAALAPGALLGAFAAGLRGVQAALCAFPLAELDASMERARRLCYTAGGRGPSGTEEATVEYGVTSRCVTLPPVSDWAQAAPLTCPLRLCTLASGNLILSQPASLALALCGPESSPSPELRLSQVLAKGKVKSLSRVRLFATQWTVAHQVPPSMGFFQARILEWIAISFSRESSQPRDQPRSPAL